MLGKKLRLDVESFPRKAKTAADTEYFFIKTAENNLSFDRVGVLVTIKVSPLAVKRNSIKRAAMDCFKDKRQPERGKGRDVLIIFKPKAGSLPKKDISAILKKYVVAI